MDCLIGYIGIKGAPDTPESGEYINTMLPGLPVGALQLTTEQDRVTFLQEWESIEKLAARRFRTAVIAEMGNRYRINTVQATIDTLKVIDKTNDQTAAAAKWRGIRASLAPDDDQLVVYSALQEIYLQEVSLYRKEATAAVTGKVFDLLTGEELYKFTIPANTEAGWTRVSLEQRFTSYSILIAFDSTAVNCVKQELSPRVTGAFQESVGKVFGPEAYIEINGASSDSLGIEVTEDDITEGNNTFGLRAVINVHCSFEPIVKQNRDKFLMAWAFLLGATLLMYRKSSSTINRWTTGIDRERSDELMTDFEGMFQEELATAIKGISMNLSDVCLACDGPIQRVYTRP